MNQREVWRTEGGGGIGGGTVSTAGNLVFQVINDGRLVAYTADTGQKLLDINTGLRGGMSPPITYLVDGVQYVSLAGGQGSNAPPPGGNDDDDDDDAESAGGGRGGRGGEAGPDIAGPGAAVAGNPRPKVMTFVLGGTAEFPDPIPADDED